MNRNLLLFEIVFLVSNCYKAQFSDIKQNPLFGADKNVTSTINNAKSLGFWVVPFSGATSP
jgi:hypothetical protein